MHQHTGRGAATSNHRNSLQQRAADLNHYADHSMSPRQAIPAVREDLATLVAVSDRAARSADLGTMGRIAQTQSQYMSALRRANPLLADEAAREVVRQDAEVVRRQVEYRASLQGQERAAEVDAFREAIRQAEAQHDRERAARLYSALDEGAPAIAPSLREVMQQADRGNASSWSASEAKFAAATAINAFEAMLAAKSPMEQLYGQLEDMRVDALLNKDYAGVVSRHFAFVEYSKNVDRRLESAKLDRDVAMQVSLHEERSKRIGNLAPAEAIHLARTEIAEYRDLPGVDDRRALAEFIGANAQANAVYRKEIDKHPEVAAAARRALTIGEPMPNAEWTQARDPVGPNGRVSLPKIYTDYAGAVVMVTATHVVQQTHRNSVVVHDLARLDNARELVQLYADGRLQGQPLMVAYGQVSGRSHVQQFDVARTTELGAIAREYAQYNIKSPQSREAFVMHVDRMMSAKMSRHAQHRPAQLPARAAQRTQELAR